MSLLDLQAYVKSTTLINSTESTKDNLGAFGFVHNTEPYAKSAKTVKKLKNIINKLKMNDPNKQYGHVGLAAIIGRPNVGKSTLMNRLLGEKVSIVSWKPQTTRNRIIGIKTAQNNQLILIDTPGIHKSRVNLNQFMVQESVESLHRVDCVLLMTEVDPDSAKSDCEKLNPDEEPRAKIASADKYILEMMRQQEVKAPVILVINKIDLLKDRRFLLPIMAEWRDKGFSNIVPISSTKGDGIDTLETEVLTLLPSGPLLYPEDMYTDQAERFLASELIREQIFLRCKQEVPYATAIEIERFQERPDRQDVFIEAVIHVERDSQKAIIIGKGGSMIKEIGIAAREEIGQLLHCPVHLKLTVHVEENWTHSPAGRRKFGYEK